MRIIVQVKFLVILAWLTVANISVANADDRIYKEVEPYEENIPKSREVFQLDLVPLKDVNFYDKQVCSNTELDSRIYYAKVCRDNCRSLYPKDSFCNNIKSDFDDLMVTFKKYPEMVCASVDKVFLREYLNEECRKRDYIKVGPITQVGNRERTSAACFNAIRNTSFIYSCEGKKISILPSQSTSLLEKVKKECLELGFKNNTEKFGECVLQLSR